MPSLQGYCEINSEKYKFVYCEWLYKINKLLCLDCIEPLCQPLLLLLPMRFGGCLGQKLTVKRYVFFFFFPLF